MTEQFVDVQTSAPLWLMAMCGAEGLRLATIATNFAELSFMLRIGRPSGVGVWLWEGTAVAPRKFVGAWRRARDSEVLAWLYWCRKQEAAEVGK